MTEEHMKTYSIALYPSTHKEYMELKDEEKWTHNEALKELVRTYREKEAANEPNIGDTK